jgi:hypothetical protein
VAEDREGDTVDGGAKAVCSVSGGGIWKWCGGGLVGRGMADGELSGIGIGEEREIPEGDSRG